MKIKKKLLLPIEITTRELDSRLLIALRVLQVNPDWEIIFGHTNKVGNYWRNKKNSHPFIFVSKGTHYSKLFYMNLIKKGGFYFLLDEEGAIFSDYVVKVFPRGGTNNDLIKYMSKIFFCGNHVKKQYKKNHSLYLSDHKIEVTGNPRFDLCKEEYEIFHSTISKHSYKKKNFIMIDTAFGGCNNIIDVESQHHHWKNLKYEKNRGEVRGNEWRDKNKPLYEYQKVLFPKFIEGIKHLCLNFPDIEFLLRPHPVEKVETHIEYFKDIKNIKISNIGTAVEKFRYAKMLIHNGCSTSVEATFSNVPSLCFLPFYDEEKVQSLPRDISIIVFNKEDLILQVKKIFNNNLPENHIATKKKYLKDYIDNIYYDSSKKIANIINNFDLTQKIKLDYDFTLRSLVHILFPNFLMKFLRIIRYQLIPFFINKDVSNSFQKRDDIKFKGLSIEDINIKVNALRDTDPGLPNPQIKVMDHQLYKLYIK